MIQMIVVLYPAEHQAMQVVAALQNPIHRNLDDLKCVAFLHRDATGKLYLRFHHSETHHENSWELLMELLFMTLSTGTQTYAAQLQNFGIDEHFINRLNVTLGRKCSGIFIVMPIMTGDKILPVLSRFGGSVLQTSLCAHGAAPVPEKLTDSVLSS